MSLLDQVRLSAFSVFGYKGGKVRHILIEKSGNIIVLHRNLSIYDAHIESRNGGLALIF